MAGWKTVVFGVLLVLVSVFSSTEVQAYVGEHLSWFGGAAGVIVVILRAITSSPIFNLEKE